MTPFEELIEAELTWLLRAGVPPRGVRISVQELLVTRIERGQLQAPDLSDAVEAAVRAAGRLARARSAPLDLVEVVCMTTLDVVRGHGGDTARWLEVATGTMAHEIERLAREDDDEARWRWLIRRVQGWP